MRFSVGDHVRVVQAVDEDATYVKTLVGKVVVIIAVDENDSEYPYIARTSTEDPVWLRDDEIAPNEEVDA